MVFNDEMEFEKNLVQVLTTKGWDPQIIKYPTEKDLINNWKDILFNNNRDRDRLNDYPLTDSEMNQILEQIKRLKTPLKLNNFINGRTISIKRDNPEDKDHYGKEISLKIYDRNEIAAGSSKYQIVEQPIFDAKDELGENRRGDVTLLINGMPVIHIELKKSGVSVGEATTQIKKYAYEGIFTGLYSLVQVFVAMTPEETLYFANPGDYRNYDSHYYFHWEDHNNEIVNDWKDIAEKLLSIPMAHQLIGFYTIPDDGDGVLKVMRSYQYYASRDISDKVSKIDYSKEHNLGGFIWHTTGSGKTMTSFKSADLISNSGDADKVIFLMDRIELGTQSLREYRGFANDDQDVQGTENTEVLINKLKSDNVQDTLIVTSIQKMSRIKEDGLQDDDIAKINKKRMVIIVDECHRDVFGDMMISIKKTFPKAILFGFTGTPIMDGNKNITADIFGDELHRYSISDGIRDKNVLGFDPYMVCTYKDNDIRRKVALEKAKASSEDEVFSNPEKKEIYNQYMQQLPMEKDIYDDDWNIIGHGIENYIKSAQYHNDEHQNAVIDNILENYNLLSQNKKYSAIFATSSIQEAIEYYNKFKSRNTSLKITGLFDPNIDNNEGFQFKEEGLKSMIDDYNRMFNMQYSLSTYKLLKDDLTARFAHKKPYSNILEEQKIDILIVVDQMLTGFDSKWINTLYLDKVLQGANIIQAFSRTNRLNGNDKPYGIIKYYRYPHSMSKYIEKAISDYSGNRPFLVFVNKLEDNIKLLNSIYTQIKEVFTSNGINNFEKLPENEVDKKKFASLFKEFKTIYTSARLQGLSDNDFERIEDVEEPVEECKVAEDSERYLNESVEFSKEDFNKIEQRGTELTRKRKDKIDNAAYDIEAYITEYDQDKIDADYLNSKFEKYMKDLKQPDISEEQLEKSLDNLHNAFAYLSQEQQKYANIFINDVQNHNIDVSPDKSFMDYIIDYQNNAKNDEIHSIAVNLSLNEDKLRELTKLDLNENNINEYGRFDELMSSVDMQKAKDYFETKDSKEYAPPDVYFKVQELLRNYILFGEL